MILMNNSLSKSKNCLLREKSRELRGAAHRTAPHRTCLLHEEMTPQKISTVWDKWPQG